jgi:hypothetical protein
MLLMLLVLLPVSNLFLPGGETRVGELTGEELGLGRDLALAAALLAADDAVAEGEALPACWDAAFPAAPDDDEAEEEERAWTDLWRGGESFFLPATATTATEVEAEAEAEEEEGACPSDLAIGEEERM